jgi:hypothetical protein
MILYVVSYWGPGSYGCRVQTFLKAFKTKEEAHAFIEEDKKSAYIYNLLLDEIEKN